MDNCRPHRLTGYILFISLCAVHLTFAAMEKPMLALRGTLSDNLWDNITYLEVSPDGMDVYALSLDGGLIRVRRSSPAGAYDLREVINLLDLTTPNRLGVMALSPDGKHLYITYGTSGNIAIMERDPATGALTRQGSFVPATGSKAARALREALDIVFDTQNRIYTACGIYGVCCMKRDPENGLLHVEQVVDEEIIRTDSTGYARSVYTCLEVSADNRFVYASSYSDSLLVVLEVDQGTGTVSPVQSLSPVAGLIWSSSTRPGRGLALSPDNRHLYLATDRGSVFRMNRDSVTGLLTGWEEPAIYSTDNGRMAQSLNFSNDGQHLYLSLQSSISLLKRDPADGALTYRGAYELTPNNFVTFSLVNSPDNSILFGALQGYDSLLVINRNETTGALSIQDCIVDTFSEIRSLDGADALLMSPGGEHVYVMAASDRSVNLFSRSATDGALTLQGVYTDPDILHLTSAAVFSEDGSMLYCVRGGWGQLMWFSRNTGTGALTCEGPAAGSTTYDYLEDVRVMAVFDTLLYIVSDRNVVWYSTNQLDSPVPLGHLSDDISRRLYRLDIENAVFSPDGRHLYAAFEHDDQVIVFNRDSTTGELNPVDTIDGCTENDWIERLSIAPDGKHLYVHCDVPGGVINLFERNPATGTLTRLDEWDGDNFGEEFIFNPDGDFLVTLPRFIQLVGRDTATGVLTVPERSDYFWDDPRSGVYSAVFSPDGRFLYATSDSKSEVHWFELIDEASVRQPDPATENTFDNGFTVNYGPHPSQLRIRFHHPGFNASGISLLSLKGAVVKHWTPKNFNSRSKDIILDTSNCKTGVYILRIHGNRPLTRRITLFGS